MGCHLYEPSLSPGSVAAKEIARQLGKLQWPKIEDLPKDEQELFEKWLQGQTVPVRTDGKAAYFDEDYRRWKAGKRVVD